MIHIENKRNICRRISAYNRIVSTECRQLDNDRLEVSLGIKVSKWPFYPYNRRVSLFICGDTKTLLNRAEEKIPAAEIVAASIHFTTPDIDGLRISMGEYPRKVCAMLPRHRYETAPSLRTNLFIIHIIAPLKFSVTKFRRLFEGMQLDMRVHMRRITRVEISADCRHLSSTIVSSPIWVRVFLIRESNTQMQQFIATATEEELIGGERFRVYYDKNNRHLDRALGKLMSVIFAPQENTALALNIRSAAAATQKYVVYSQIVGAKIERCDDARIRCSIREPFGVERMCPIIYFCDGAFPFRDLDITYTLLF